MTIVALAAGEVSRLHGSLGQDPGSIPRWSPFWFHRGGFMARKSFAFVRKLKVVFFFLAAFTVVVALTAAAQEITSSTNYDRPWQHFAGAGQGEAQGLPAGELRSDETVYRSPASAKVNFPKAVPYTTSGYNPYSVALADVNGDGNLDLIVANESQSKNDSQGSISVMLGKGDGKFHA